MIDLTLALERNRKVGVKGSTLKQLLVLQKLPLSTAILLAAYSNRDGFKLRDSAALCQQCGKNKSAFTQALIKLADEGLIDYKHYVSGNKSQQFYVVRPTLKELV